MPDGNLTLNQCFLDLRTQAMRRESLYNTRKKKKYYNEIKFNLRSHVSRAIHAYLKCHTPPGNARGINTSCNLYAFIIKSITRARADECERL